MTVVLCAGEALITLSAADGLPLDSTQALRISPGGAEFNVAVHLARLGMSVRFAGLVGADPWGRRLLATLAAEGVDTSAVRTEHSRRTGCYLKEPGSVYYYRAGSAGSALARLPDGAHDGVTHVHLTGITPALSPACAEFTATELAAAGPAGRTTSFDINYRPALWSPAEAGPVLLNLAAMARYVFVGLDEARLVWGCQSAEEIRALIPAPAELIVKDGPRAAIAFSSGGEGIGVLPGPVEIVDVVGAGDAFAAGYLAGRLSGSGSGSGDVAAALRAGHALAAAVIGSPSDHGERAIIEVIMEAEDA
ncbi:MAG TPA: sugar kinase [Streptosporangiaceae bacterium]